MAIIFEWIGQQKHERGGQMRNIEMDGRHKETPLVCIAITCYNHEKYVRQALESAINQTYDNTVILISDDGSKRSEERRVGNECAALCCSRWSRLH